MSLLPHPAADFFPLLQPQAFEELKADIARVGLLQPIWTYEGLILDGRNRYKACIELGIEPRFQEYVGDCPVAGAWSLNGRRRHLSKRELALIAVKMLPALKAEAKKRQGQRSDLNIPPVPVGPNSNVSTGEASAQAAKIVGVGKTIINEAAALQRDRPDLYERVEKGELSVDKAAKIKRGIYLPPDTQLKQPKAKRLADIERLASEGYRAQQISQELGIGIQRVRELANAAGIVLPDATIGKVHDIKAKRVIEETATGLEGYVIGLRTINLSALGLTADAAMELATSIGQSLKALQNLRKHLLEYCREQAA